MGRLSGGELSGGESVTWGVCQVGNLSGGEPVRGGIF